MARFDVCANTGPHSTHTPYLLDVQSDLIAELSTRVVVMAARPGRMVDEVVIDEPYPRGADFRVSTAFSGYVAASTVARTRHAADHGAPHREVKHGALLGLSCAT